MTIIRQNATEYSLPTKWEKLPIVIWGQEILIALHVAVCVLDIHGLLTQDYQPQVSEPVFSCLEICPWDVRDTHFPAKQSSRQASQGSNRAFSLTTIAVMIFRLP